MDLVLLCNLLQKMGELGMMNNNQYKAFNSQEKLAKELAITIANILRDSLTKHKIATLFVSGGNTPKLFFKYLSQCAIEWENVYIGLVDERMVPTNNPNSNEYLIRKELLQNKAKKAKVIGMYQETDESVAQMLCSNRYALFFPRVDALVLGMGTDGHTASLFPNNPKLQEAFDAYNQNYSVLIHPTTAPYTRMSLTLASILKAENIFLHIEGKEKIGVYTRALTSKNYTHYPIAKVLDSEKSIKVYAYE